MWHTSFCELGAVISSTFSPINLQHLQFLWARQGTVSPLFFPSAMDLRTDNLLPTLAPVFFTYWNIGFAPSLKEFVFESSSSYFHKCFDQFLISAITRNYHYRLGRDIVIILFSSLELSFHALHFVTYTQQHGFRIPRLIKRG